MLPLRTAGIKKAGIDHRPTSCKRAGQRYKIIYQKEPQNGSFWFLERIFKIFVDS
jgi:hypothetical protein